MSQKSKIKIGLDARTLNVLGGSERYLDELIKRIKRKDQIELNLYGEDLNGYVNQSFLRIFWENLNLPVKAKLDNLDLFHGPKEIIPLTFPQKKVVTIHDLVFLESDKVSLRNKVYGKFIVQSLKNADKIISVSNSTKKDVIKNINVDSQKIEVVYLGVDKKFQKLEENIDSESFLKKFGINCSFNNLILNVSSFYPRKNQIRLIKSFESMNDDNVLILIGKETNFSKKIFEYISNSDFSNRIFHLSNISDRELIKFYNLADVFVFPSLYEGFGLPVLEAMACGTPVIASDTSSLPEVVGEAGLLVNPEDTDDLSKAIEEILEDDELKKKLSKKGLKRSKKFNWNKTAKETVKVYKEVIKSG